MYDARFTPACSLLPARQARNAHVVPSAVWHRRNADGTSIELTSGRPTMQARWNISQMPQASSGTRCGMRSKADNPRSLRNVLKLYLDDPMA
jgi:hypothetical protein